MLSSCLLYYLRLKSLLIVKILEQEETEETEKRIGTSSLLSLFPPVLECILVAARPRWDLCGS
jgi:hypothetical protein